MKYCIVWLSICTLLMTMPVVSAAADSNPAEDKFLQEITLRKRTVGGEALYHFRDDIYLSVDHHIEGSEKDYGARFSVLRVTEGRSTVTYSSRGSFDSYFLRPSFFSTGVEGEALLVLAETGTEYSWGARVFKVSADGAAKDLGSLDVAVIEDPENDTVSVIPYTRIKAVGNGYEFTFTKDVIFDPGGLEDRQISKDRIKYVYDGRSLGAIRTDP